MCPPPTSAIALGAWLGGLANTADLGYIAPLSVGAVIVPTAAIVMIIAASQTRPSTLDSA
jgi:DHA1 family inner membrane transport protein